MLSLQTKRRRDNADFALLAEVVEGLDLGSAQDAVVDTEVIESALEMFSTDLRISS